VHRSSAAEVFLTDVRRSGPDRFVAAALWPRSHPTFPRGRDDRHSPLLVVETLRQLGIYLPLVYYGVARDARLLIRDLAFDLDPAAEPRAGYGATEVVCLAEVGKLRREGPGLPPIGLRLTVRYLSGGQEFARATGGARFAAPARYAELRGAGAAAAGPVLPAPTVLAPAVGGESTAPAAVGPDGTANGSPSPNGRNGSNIVSDSPPGPTPPVAPAPLTGTTATAATPAGTATTGAPAAPATERGTGDAATVAPIPLTGTKAATRAPVGTPPTAAPATTTPPASETATATSATTAPAAATGTGSASPATAQPAATPVSAPAARPATAPGAAATPAPAPPEASAPPEAPAVAFAPLRPAPADVAVSSPSDVLVALAEGLVLVDPADPLHPFFFDHPSDHVPGMALLEAARQSAALASGGRLLRPVGAWLRALRFTEARPAAVVECVDHGLTCVFRVRQGGGVTACGVLRYGARPGA
jgi:hypothetical protein